MSRHPVSQRRQLLVALCCLCAVGYLGVHAFYGRHGLESRYRLLSRSETLSADIGRLETVRQGLARDVALLTPERPDPNLLGFARPNDRIVVLRGPVL
jgi:cell division protein FtsB